MSLKKLSIFLLGMATVLLTACHKEPQKIPTYSDLNKAILVTKDQPYFQVQLKSNPTTGYSWMFMQDKNNNFIQVVKHEYQAPNNNLAGSPGFELWTFKVDKAAFNAKQSLYLKMDYQRPWEKNPGGPGAALTFKIDT